MGIAAHLQFRVFLILRLMASIRLSCHVSESLVVLGFLMMTSRCLGFIGPLIVSILRFLAAFRMAPMPFVMIVI